MSRLRESIRVMVASAWKKSIYLTMSTKKKKNIKNKKIIKLSFYK